MHRTPNVSRARLTALTGAAVVITSSLVGCGHQVAVASHPLRLGTAEDSIAVSARVRMGAGPTGIGYGDGQLWVTRDNNTLARVDPRTRRISASWRVGRFPVRVAVAGQWAWVANSGGDTVSQLDVRTGRVRRTIPVGDQPSGIVIAAHAVWVVCASDTRLFRIDPRTGEIAATIPIGSPPDDIPAIAAGPAGLWVTALNRVARIDTATNTVAAVVPVPAPTDVAVGRRDVWVSSIDRRRVTRIRARSNAVSGSFPVGHGPSGLVLAMNRLWVLDNADSTVSAMDPASGHMLATVSVGPYSYDIAATHDAVWIQSYADQAVYEIRPGPNSAPSAPTRTLAA